MSKMNFRVNRSGVSKSARKQFCQSRKRTDERESRREKKSAMPLTHAIKQLDFGRVVNPGKPNRIPLAHRSTIVLPRDIPPQTTRRFIDTAPCRGHLFPTAIREGFTTIMVRKQRGTTCIRVCFPRGVI